MSKKSDSKPAGRRRDALRKLVISGGVIGAAGAWSKPVVDSVMLPAHAQTSLPLEDPCSGIVIQGLNQELYNVQVTGQVLGPGNSGIPIHIQVRVSGFGNPDTQSTNTVTNGSGQYNAILGPFDACSGGTNVKVTISSSAFAGVAVCTATASKICI